MTSNLRAALLALASFGLFATHDVFVKVLGAVYSPFQIVFFSVLFSFPLATLMMIADSTPGVLLPRHPWWMALRTAATVITGLTAFYAFSTLPLAQVYSLLFAAPMVVTLLAIPVLGERIGLHRGVAIVVGLLGVLIVLRPGAAPLGLGHLAALAAAVCSSVAGIVVRKIGHDERPVVLLLYPMLANVILMGIALIWVYKPMPAEHLGILALVSVLAWYASRLIVMAYSKGEAAIVAPMQYSQIIWATLYGLVFFGETIDRPTALGAAVVIASGVYIVMRESAGGHSRTTPVLRTRSRPETGTSLRIGPLIRLRRARK